MHSFKISRRLMIFTLTSALALLAFWWAHSTPRVIAQGPPVCVTPPLGMVSWWPGDGNANDIQGSNNGTLNGATFAAGKVAQAFSFDGVDDYVDVGNVSGLNAMTVDAWVFITPATNTGSRTVIGNLIDQRSSIGYALMTSAADHTGNPGRAAFIIRATDVNGETEVKQIAEAPAALTAGWHQLAGSRDTAGQIKLYVDGVEVAGENSTFLAGPISATQSTRIGLLSQTPFFIGDPFQGLIDEVELFNRVLSADEIQAIFNADSAGKCKPGGNTAPTFTPAAATARQQDSPAGAAVPVGTADDAQTAAGSLTVTQIAGGTATGITVTGITNTNGAITAMLSASCTATTGTVRFQVSDGSLTGTGDLQVNVTVNTAPTLTYANANVALNGATTVNPATGPADNGTINTIAVQSQGAYTGTLSVDNATGIVSLSNAAPAGMHAITIRATDNCNAITDASFTLTVGCVTSPTVNNIGDGADATPGNGVCETALGNGICTLRAAIQEANALPACTPFTINFSVNGAILLASALPALDHPNLTINGPGANLLTVQRNTGGNYRIFELNAGRTASLIGLTITGGNVTGDGGGVLNSGILTITRCQVTANTASSFGGGVGNAFNSTLSINDSTIANNTTDSNQSGGGIDNAGTLTVTNSTISGNVADQNSSGGGLFSYGGTVTVTNCTFTDNQAAGIGSSGGVLTEDGAVTARNNLIAANRSNTTTPDVSLVNVGTFTSLGFNIIGNVGEVTTFNQAGDQTGTGATPLNPVIGALANNGGTTPTHALLPGSPAINTGTNTGAPATDQRGIARPQQTTTDIGAFESRGFALAVTNGDNQTTPVNMAFANPLVVAVSSANGEPVNGGRVTFTPPGAGASASLTGNPATIAGGQASVTATANGTAGGPYNVAANATGAAAAVNFALTNTGGANAPTFTPAAALARQQGSAAGAAVTVGTVADAQTPAGNLTVMQIAGGSATGITVTNIVNTNGTVTAQVSAGCTATSGTVRFQVSDGSLTGTGDLQVNVTANTAPVLTYANANVATNGATTVNPATGPTDNGTLDPIVVQSQGTYTGTISVNASGVVSISNAAPVGAHTITIRATDNCSVATDATFTLMVGGSGLQFYPLAHPIRLLDTRLKSTGCDAPGAMLQGQTVRLQTAAGRTCDGLTIPANAAVVTGNVSTVNPLAQGFLTLYPSDATLPLAANSNYLPNQVLNNVFTVGLGANDGAFNIYVLSTTDVVVDITGYYAPPGAGGLYFHPLPTPVRLLETRPGEQVGCFRPGTPLLAGQDFTQLGNGTCGIPSTALALVGNATTVNPLAQGFLTLFPADAMRPLASSGNYTAGQTLNSPFTVGLSPSGEFKVYPLGETHLVIDVHGYFSADGSDANGAGLLFSPLVPVRLLDTRTTSGCFMSSGMPIPAFTDTLQPARGLCTIPSTAQAILGNATTVGPAAQGFLTFWPSNAARPFVATSNFEAGQNFNRHFTVGLGTDGAFKIYAFTSTHLVVDVSGYFAP